MLNNSRSFRIDPLVGLLFSILTIVLIYLFIKGLYAMAYWIIPILVILTLILDYKVYLNFGKSIINLFKNSIVWGIAAVLGTVVLFPFVAIFLFAKAGLKRWIKKRFPQFNQERKVREDGYLEYEEIESEEVEILELPEVEKSKQKSDNNPYDDYFEIN